MGRYSKTPGICKNFKDSRTFAIQVISNGKFKRINLSTLNLARGAIDVKKYDFRKSDALCDESVTSGHKSKQK